VTATPSNRVGRHWLSVSTSISDLIKTLI